MSVLKLTSCIACLLCLTVTSDAQVLRNIGKRVEDKVNQQVGKKATEKSNDDTDDEETKVKEDEDGDVKVKSGGTKVKADGEGNSNELTYSSKYDFVPGEKVVAYEDFAKEAIGEFPTRWNTNGSAEVVTLNKKEGKWLKINHEGYFFPEFIANIPENSSLEFDLGVNNNYDWGSQPLKLYIGDLKNREGFSNFNNWHNTHYVELQFHPIRGDNYTGEVWLRTGGAENPISNNGHARKWDNKGNLFAHVALWRQGQRLRVYVNGDKLFDLPKLFQPNSKYNAVILNTDGFQNGKDDFMVIGNMRLAVGAPDTRNKLVSEGKFVTHGILFDVNSDKIKPESAGALRDVGMVLSENSSLKVKIVGHTDSDGDDKANMDLSKRRAEAVKNYLVKEFHVPADNLTTEGKGESQPVDKNDTAEGKANNRRVEFIKM